MAKVWLNPLSQRKARGPCFTSRVLKGSSLLDLRRRWRTPGAGTTGRALAQELELARIAGERRRPLELRARLVEAAELGEEVAAHARQEVVACERGLRRSASTSSSPAAGPNAIATATARFSSTTGDGVSWASAS